MGNPYAPPGESSRPSGSPPPPGAGPTPGGGGPDAGPTGWPAQDAPRHGTPDDSGAHHAGPGGPTGGPGAPVPGGGEPGRRRPQPAPDSEIVRATSRRVLRFLALLLASVLVSGLPLPWQIGSMVFLVAAIVLGIQTLVLAVRGGIRGGLVVMLGVGVPVAGFVAFAMLLSWLVLWPQQVERQECLARAVTISANRQCEVAFQRALEERLSTFGERTTPAP